MPDMHQPASPTDDGVRDANPSARDHGVGDEHPTGESQARQNTEDDPPA